MNMYSIKNCGAEEFFTPFLAKTDIMAIYEVQKYYDKQEDIPFDLQLYLVGAFNVNNGFIAPSEPKLIKVFDKKSKNISINKE